MKQLRTMVEILKKIKLGQENSIKKILFLIVVCVEVSCNESTDHSKVYEFKSIDEIMTCPPKIYAEKLAQRESISIEINLTGLELEKYHIYSTDTLSAYYFERKLKQLSVLKNSLHHGTHLEFNENGILTSYGRIDSGVSNGMFQSFNDKGELYKVSLVFNGETICNVEY